MSFFDDLFDRFHELHTDIVKAVDGLPIEALDWAAGPEMNSICVLVIHLCGAERYWIGDVVVGERSSRVRDEEFGVQGLSAGELTQRLTAADEYAKDALSRLSLADLEAVRTSPRNGKPFRVGWSLTHALEHTALHLGQIQLTRQLWEQKHKA